MPAESHGSFGFALQHLPWSQLAPGLREKVHISGPRKFRLLEFSEPFREPDWCVTGHAGYVLQGEMVVKVEDELVTYRSGDVIDLPEGVRHRHEATIQTVTLFLIEDAS